MQNISKFPCEFKMGDRQMKTVINQGKVNAPMGKKSGARAQTAIEYLLLVGTAVVFVTIVAYFIKTALNK